MWRINGNVTVIGIVLFYVVFASMCDRYHGSLYILIDLCLFLLVFHSIPSYWLLYLYIRYNTISTSTTLFDSQRTTKTRVEWTKKNFFHFNSTLERMTRSYTTNTKTHGIGLWRNCNRQPVDNSNSLFFLHQFIFFLSRSLYIRN